MKFLIEDRIVEPPADEKEWLQHARSQGAEWVRVEKTPYHYIQIALEKREQFYVQIRQGKNSRLEEVIGEDIEEIARRLREFQTAEESADHTPKPVPGLSKLWQADLRTKLILTLTINLSLLLIFLLLLAVFRPGPAWTGPAFVWFAAMIVTNMNLHALFTGRSFGEFYSANAADSMPQYLIDMVLGLVFNLVFYAFSIFVLLQK